MRGLEQQHKFADYITMGGSTSSPTTERLEALLADVSLLERTFFLQPNIDLELLETKLAIARELRNPRVLARVLCVKGRAHALLSEYTPALLSAQEAIAIFGQLSPEEMAVCAGSFAEAKRVHARVLSHFDRLSEALPLFAESVQIAHLGVERFSSDKQGVDFAFAASALFRSLLGFGVCLINIDDFDTAIDTYYQALAIPPISAELWPNFTSDLTMVRSSLVDALHERARRFREAHQDATCAQDLTAARVLLDVEALRLSATLAGDSPAFYGQSLYYEMWGKHFLLTGEPVQSQEMFEKQLGLSSGHLSFDLASRNEALTGLAEALLAQGQARESLDTSLLALAGLDENDNVYIRARVLFVRAEAQRALGMHDEAYDSLQAHHRLRSHPKKIASYWNSIYKKLTEALAELRITRAALESRTQELERLSLTDPLTGLPNRRHLYERAASEIERLHRTDGSLAVALFDVDHFKKVNDTYGHEAGDSVLMNIACAAGDKLRSLDFLARLGGEEFAVLIPDVNFNEAVAVIERLRQTIAQNGISMGDGTRMYVTASFGVTRFDPASDSFDTALSRADALCYKAKEAGRNSVCESS
jgi:diguanylate cyclase (GGDEF)-like protein